MGELAGWSIATGGITTQKCHPHIGQSDAAHSILLRKGHPMVIDVYH